MNENDVHSWDCNTLLCIKRCCFNFNHMLFQCLGSVSVSLKVNECIQYQTGLLESIGPLRHFSYDDTGNMEIVCR